MYEPTKDRTGEHTKHKDCNGAMPTNPIPLSLPSSERQLYISSIAIPRRITLEDLTQLVSKATASERDWRPVRRSRISRGSILIRFDAGPEGFARVVALLARLDDWVFIGSDEWRDEPANAALQGAWLAVAGFFRRGERGGCRCCSDCCGGGICDL